MDIYSKLSSDNIMPLLKINGEYLKCVNNRKKEVYCKKVDDSLKFIVNAYTYQCFHFCVNKCYKA